MSPSYLESGKYANELQSLKEEQQILRNNGQRQGVNSVGGGISGEDINTGLPENDDEILR